MPDLLARLAAEGPIPAQDAALVVAHPDDETIGLGGQLARLPGLALVHVTDGAPRGGGAAEAHGFADAAAYAAARRAELEAAVGLAGVPRSSLTGLGVPDQEVCLSLARLARGLAALFAERGIRAVLTHAYEGGHPDHDGTAFAVHAAAHLAARRTGHAVDVLELPFYHLGGRGRSEEGDVDHPQGSGGDAWAVQCFAPGPGGPGIALRLNLEQQALKRRMLDAHRSQAGVLQRVGTEVERVRRSPAHSFACLPNGGRLLYEHYGWGMTGERYLGLVAGAARELGLPR